MADERIAVTQIVRGGVAPSYDATLSASDTYQVANDGRVFLHFKKTGAGACTVTVISTATAGDLAVADPTFNVPATTGDVMAGPFPPGIFNDTNGDLEFTVSEATGLSVAALRL